MTDRWATYKEAGQQFGLSADAMRKRARRMGWRVQAGNDGRARVLVPEGAGLSPDGRSGRAPSRPDDRADDPQALAALADALRQERERREAAEAAIVWSQGEAAGLREAVRLAEEGIREARQRDADFQNTLEQAARAQAEAAALREVAARAEAQIAEATSLTR